MAVVFITLIVLMALLCLGFTARIVAAMFSPVSVEYVWKSPLKHLLWFCAFPAIYWLWIALMWWPPDWVTRNNQRKMVLERVENAGGWDTIRQECIGLTQQYNEGFVWMQRSSSEPLLAPALEALKPKRITYLPPLPNSFPDESPIPIVHIEIFGTHATGGHSTPYYGLKILCSSNINSFQPKPLQGGLVTGEVRKITPEIFELY